MAVTKESIEVSFNSDADYLIQGLTADVSTIECIYDLVDNSIDAARSKILNGTKPTKKDAFGLPASYKGFKIDLKISASAVSILDNCTGLEESTLSEKVFTIGKKSKHAFGIGHYGVGLNRAIFKLGSSVQLKTDNGKHAFSLEFTEDDVRSAVESKSTIKAQRQPTANSNYYRLEIGGIKRDVLGDLGSETWEDSLREQIRIRYAIFCKKGILITVNGKKCGEFGPEIRNPGFLKRKTKNLMSQNGVSIYLEAGLHENYRIAKIDSDYAQLKPIIKNLTPEYGWYIVCNDRIILVADKSKTTGWTTSWHNEYHGFLGWAHYVSEDPSLLPWDTKKTGINTNHQTHVEVLSSLKELADDYRTRNRQLRKSKSGGGVASAPAKPGAGGSGGGVGGSKAIHTKDMDMLIYDISAKSNSPRIASFLHEAKEISIKEHPYTAMILLRVLFEAALRDYLLRHKHYQKVKDFVFQEQASQGRSFTAKQKNDFTPALSSMLSWSAKNTEIFDSDVRRGTKTSIDSFIKDVSRLNGIVHEDGVLTDFSEAKQIRNNAYKALQTLLEG